MSIKVMTMVFDRYPAGGNERLLALAMADHAKDDGTRIWPSVGELARKTMQSERTVQRQIAKMLESGWLLKVRSSTGRVGDTNEYRISPEWIAGGDLPGSTGDNLTPVTGDRLTPVNGGHSVDNVIHTGDTTGLTGDTTGLTGDTAMSPESSRTIKNQYPLTPVRTGECEQPRNRTAGQPNSRSPKAPWRWRETWDGVCRRGEQLGMPYSTAALGTCYGDDQLTKHRVLYRAAVEAAHERAEGGRLQ